jgi:hypothetical protein
MDLSLESGTSTGEPEVSQIRYIGDGPIPESLSGFNWNAMAWGALWALVYRVWPWFWIFVGTQTVTAIGYFVAFRWLRVSDWASGQTWVVPVLMAVFTVPGMILAVWFGSVASRRLWAREAALSHEEAFIPLNPFIRAQSRWFTYWIILTLGASLVELFVARGDGPALARALGQDAVIVMTFIGVWCWLRFAQHSAADSERGTSNKGIEQSARR